MDCTDKKEPKVVGLTPEAALRLNDATVGRGFTSKSGLVAFLARKMMQPGRPLHERVEFKASMLAQRTSRATLMLTARERADLNKAIVACDVADASEFIEGALRLLEQAGLEGL